MARLSAEAAPVTRYMGGRGAASADGAGMAPSIASAVGSETTARGSAMTAIGIAIAASAAGSRGRSETPSAFPAIYRNASAAFLTKKGADLARPAPRILSMK